MTKDAYMIVYEDENPQEKAEEILVQYYPYDLYEVKLSDHFDNREHAEQVLKERIEKYSKDEADNERNQRILSKLHKARIVEFSVSITVKEN